MDRRVDRSSEPKYDMQSVAYLTDTNGLREQIAAASTYAVLAGADVEIASVLDASRLERANIKGCNGRSVQRTAPIRAPPMQARP